MNERFTGSFTQQEPIPEEGIEAALNVLRSGRLHRYNVADGEAGETALLEQEFAEQLGVKYCLAVASGGYAMGAALRAMGVGPGDHVLTNAFTLAPVPGAIAAVGAVPVFVGVTEDLTIDQHTGIAYISSLDRRTPGKPGAIFGLDLTAPASKPVNLTPSAQADFQPHGPTSRRT